MKKPSPEAVMKRVEEWFPGAQSYWKTHHDRFNKSKTFAKAAGENGQWTDDEVMARNSTNPPRVTLTENLLGPFGNQVANDLKQSDFGAQVKGKDNGTDPKLAEMRQGFHRGIQQIGGFKAALDQAADDLIFGGLGAFRFVTRYADQKSFQKEIEYQELDPTRLFHGDGSHRKSNFSDVTDSLVFEPYSEARFKQEFKKDPKQFLSAGECSPVWGNNNTPWVSDYFFKDETPEKLLMCVDGKERYASEVSDLLKDPGKLMAAIAKRPDLQAMAQIGMALTAADLTEVDQKTGEPITRESTRCQIWWCKLAGKEVLEIEAWPGLFIPNFLATGRKIGKAGEIKFVSLLEPAFGVQRAHNYAFSAMVERAGKSPKTRTYAALESIPPQFQNDWDGAATSNKEMLYYNAFDSAGNALPAPSHSQPIQTDPAFADLRAMTEQGIRNVLGMWESALGAKSNEKSGVAIRARESQADTGNYDWGANLALAAEHCFVATDEIANKVYDVATQVRIVGEDDKESVIWAASLEENDPNPNGYFDLNRGKYDIRCRMAPSADTKREEQSQGLEMLFQGNPEMTAVMAPEFIALQPWKGAEKMSKIAASYRALKFPGISDGEEKEQQIPPQVQQQLQTMQQQMQEMQAQLQQAGPEVQKAKMEAQAAKADKSIDAERVRIEKFKADTDRMKVQAELNFKQGEMLLRSDELQFQKSRAQVEDAFHARERQHAESKDGAEIALKAKGQAHAENKDRAGFEQAGEKMRLDHEAKTSQLGKPTGATGKSPTPGVKGANS